MAQERQLKLLDELRARHVVAQARFQVAQQVRSAGAAGAAICSGPLSKKHNRN